MACAAALTSLARGQLPCSYTVTVLPNSPCFNFQSPANPVAINNLGHVLLYGSNCGEPGYDETYIWTGGPTLTLIPRPAGMLGFTGADMNDNGVIVGQAQYASPVGPRAVIYDHGDWTTLPPLNPPDGWSSASAINNNSEVCGYRSIGTAGGDPVNPYQAFRWSAAKGFEDFGNPDGFNTAGRDINDLGDVSVSSGMVAVGAFAYLWLENGTMVQMQPPLCISSEGGRLTDARLLTTGGIVQESPFQSRGFLYRNEAYVEMPPLAGATTASYLGIAESGLVCGRSNFGSASNSRACLWVNGQPIDLHTMVPSNLGLTLRAAWISRNGRIIARGFATAGDNKDFLVTPVVPSPGDVNCDGQVDVNDLLQVVTTWGPCAGCRSDMSGDGHVSVTDLLQVILNWDA